MATPIRGQTRPLPIKAGLIETKKINADINAAIHNRFDVEVVDARTGKVRQRARGENVICNQLWTRMLSPATYFNYIHYGTGSGTPAASDTSLFTFLGYGAPSTADDVYSIDYANGTVSLRRKIQLSETTANGSTLTEVGIGHYTAASTLCTHAMLKDANGNQISIVKTSTDIINIYATVYAHWNNAVLSSNGIKMYNNLKNPLFLLLLGINSTWTGYAAISNTNPFPTALYRNSSADLLAGVFTATYSAATKSITLVLTRVAVGSGNFGGIKSVGIRASDSFGGHESFSLSSNFSGLLVTAITGEAIGTGDGTISDFATAFPFIHDATIYVNGVQASEATVDENLPLSINDMGRYFEWMPEYSSDFEAVNRVIVPSPCLEVTNVSGASGITAVYFNPYYEYGITSISYSGITVYTSDDLQTWTYCSQTVPSAQQHAKYWKLVTDSVSNFDYKCRSFTTAGLTGKNIHFATPPISGAVITANYTTNTVAKDVNHVFDLSVTIQLGEYAG